MDDLFTMTAVQLTHELDETEAELRDCRGPYSARRAYHLMHRSTTIRHLLAARQAVAS